MEHNGITNLVLRGLRDGLVTGAGMILSTFFFAFCCYLADRPRALFTGEFGIDGDDLSRIFKWSLVMPVHTLRSTWGLLPLGGVVYTWYALVRGGNYCLYLPGMFGLQILCVFAAIIADDGFDLRYVPGLALAEASVLVWIGAYFLRRKLVRSRGRAEN